MDHLGHELEQAAAEWRDWQRRPVTRSLDESNKRKQAERRLIRAIDAVLGDEVA